MFNEQVNFPFAKKKKGKIVQKQLKPLKLPRVAKTELTSGKSETKTKAKTGTTYLDKTYKERPQLTH